LFILIIVVSYFIYVPNPRTCNVHKPDITHTVKKLFSFSVDGNSMMANHLEKIIPVHNHNETFTYVYKYI